MNHERNHARSKAARAYQAAHPGTSYTRALRIVTNAHRRPLTALLGRARDGRPVTANLESESNGGGGPHCTVVGASHEETRAMLQYLGARLTAGQQRADLELITSCSDPIKADTVHVLWSEPQLGDLFDEHLDARHRLLASLKCADAEIARQAGHRIPTTVVLVESPAPELVKSGQLERWSRVGRSAGVSIVLGLKSRTAPTYSPDDALGLHAIHRLLIDQVGPAAAANLSTTTVVHLGDNRGRLTVAGPPIRGRRRGGISTVFTMQSA